MMAMVLPPAGQPSRWNLVGKTALVTGATKGIGRAIAEELAGLGASVYICARSESDVKERVQEWKEAGLAIDGSVCDVSSLDSCKQLIAAVSDHFAGKLDILAPLISSRRALLVSGQRMVFESMQLRLDIHIQTSWTKYDVLALTQELTEETTTILQARTPLGRLGEAKEIAGTVAFLCMPCSYFTTGVILAVDGGMTAHYFAGPCPPIEK